MFKYPLNVTIDTNIAKLRNEEGGSISGKQESE